MSLKLSKKMSWISSLLWIVGSAMVFSVVSYKAIYYGLSKNRKSSEKQKIDYIVQTGPYKEALHSDYLTEILGLSVDHPLVFSSFSVGTAEKQLLSSPVIQQAHVKKIKPNMVYVDYSLRKPLAWASDFVNTALDKEGALFPMYPFFSPKRLPEFYFGELGLKESAKDSLKEPLSGKYVDVAFSLLELFSENGKDLFFVKKIDVSEAFSLSLGKREIVVVLENEIYLDGEEKPALSTHFLRLSLKNFTKEVANYLKLRDHLLEADKQELSLIGAKAVKEKVIDLRLSQLAFIE